MTIGLAFHFENNDRDVYSGRAIDLDGWRIMGKAFGVSKFAVIDKTTLTIDPWWNDSSVPLAKQTQLETFETLATKDVLVCAETPWSFTGTGVTPTELQDFVHPSDAGKTVWYVIGPTTGLYPQVGDGKTWITIPQVGVGAMYGLHAAAIILADRYLKGLT